MEPNEKLNTDDTNTIHVTSNNTNTSTITTNLATISNILKKDTLQSSYNSYCEFTRKTNDEQEKILKFTNELLIILASNKFFTKEKIETDEEKFFVSTLGPKIIKTIINEFINDAFIKLIALDILEILVIEFSNNIGNKTFIPMWEEMSEMFIDNKSFFCRCLNDASENYWVIIYNIII